MTQFMSDGPKNLGTHLYFNYTGSAPDGTSLTELATAIMAECVTHIIPVCQTDFSITQIEVYDLSVVDGPVGLFAQTTNGSRSGGILPIQVAALANYSIARRYRGGKPKGFWPFGSDTDLEATNAWTSAAQTAFLAALNSYIAAISATVAGGVTIGAHVAVSYYSGFTNEPYGVPVKYRRIPTPRVTPLVDPVTTVAIPLKLSSQRRRRIG